MSTSTTEPKDDAKGHVPVYLDEDVQAYLAAIATKKGVSLSDLVNDLLKRTIAIIDVIK